MWKATGICVLIGWGVGILALATSTGVTNFYDLFTALGMGLVLAGLGFMVILVRRKSGDFTPAYWATAIVGLLVVLGGMYGG